MDLNFISIAMFVFGVFELLDPPNLRDHFTIAGEASSVTDATDWSSKSVP